MINILPIFLINYEAIILSLLYYVIQPHLQLGMPYYGHYAMYGGGGYIADLGTSSLQATRQIGIVTTTTTI